MTRSNSRTWRMKTLEILAIAAIAAVTAPEAIADDRSLLEITQRYKRLVDRAIALSVRRAFERPGVTRPRRRARSAGTSGPEKVDGAERKVPTLSLGQVPFGVQGPALAGYLAGTIWERFGASRGPPGWIWEQLLALFVFIFEIFPKS